MDRKPVREIAEASKTGAATNLISGLATGFMSTLLPVIVIISAIFVSFYFGGFYGILEVMPSQIRRKRDAGKKEVLPRF